MSSTSNDTAILLLAGAGLLAWYVWGKKDGGPFLYNRDMSFVEGVKHPGLRNIDIGQEANIYGHRYKRVDNGFQYMGTVENPDKETKNYPAASQIKIQNDGPTEPPTAQEAPSASPTETTPPSTFSKSDDSSYMSTVKNVASRVSTGVIAVGVPIVALAGAQAGVNAYNRVRRQNNNFEPDI
jgi:hypothetical protein